MLVCSSAGNYRPHDERPAVSPTKQRGKGLAPRTYKSQCKAHIEIMKEIGIENLRVRWFWEHTGHEPGTLKDLADHHMARASRDWLDQRVEQGFNWKCMKGLLRLEEAALEVRCALLCILGLHARADIGLHTGRDSRSNPCVPPHQLSRRCQCYLKAPALTRGQGRRRREEHPTLGRQARVTWLWLPL